MAETQLTELLKDSKSSTKKERSEEAMSFVTEFKLLSYCPILWIPCSIGLYFPGVNDQANFLYHISQATLSLSFSRFSFLSHSSTAICRFLPFVWLIFLNELILEH